MIDHIVKYPITDPWIAAALATSLTRPEAKTLWARFPVQQRVV